MLGKSPDGVAEAICVQGEGLPFVLAVQWHPERSAGDGISERIFDAFIGAASES